MHRVAVHTPVVRAAPQKIYRPRPRGDVVLHKHETGPRLPKVRHKPSEAIRTSANRYLRVDPLLVQSKGGRAVRVGGRNDDPHAVEDASRHGR